MKFGFIIEDGRGEEGQRWRMKTLIPHLEAMGDHGEIFPGNPSGRGLLNSRRLGTLSRIVAVKRHGVDVLVSCADPATLRSSLRISSASCLPLVIFEDRDIAPELATSLPNNCRRLSLAKGETPKTDDVIFCPLPPEPSLGTIPSIVRARLRKKLKIDDSRFVVYCQNAPPPPELFEASEALLEHSVFSWLVPHASRSKKGHVIRKSGLSYSEELAVSDATYIHGDGPWAVAALLDSLAAERPVLLHASEGSPAFEALEASKGGLHLPLETKNSLQVGAFSLYADAGLRARLAKNGTDYLHRHYSWNGAAQILSSLAHKK